MLNAPARLFAFLNDPRTKRGTAFYVGMGLAAYDVLQRGLNWANGTILAALAGVEVVSRLAGPAAPPEPPAPGVQ